MSQTGVIFWDEMVMGRFRFGSKWPLIVRKPRRLTMKPKIKYSLEIESKAKIASLNAVSTSVDEICAPLVKEIIKAALDTAIGIPWCLWQLGRQFQLWTQILHFKSRMDFSRNCMDYFFSWSIFQIFLADCTFLTLSGYTLNWKTFVYSFNCLKILTNGTATALTWSKSRRL